MKKVVSSWVLPAGLGVVLALQASIFELSAQAQSAAPVNGVAAAAALTLPPGASTKKVDEFLATLKPPTSVKALLSGNDLLLEIPDIAQSGPVRAKIVSTIARTDGMWLLSLHPAPDSGNVLFAALQLDVAALPEATLTLQLYKTQSLLLLARAGGKYYATYHEVKISLAKGYRPAK